MEIKKTTTLGNLTIKSVSKALAKEMIVKNHYSHKWNDGGLGNSTTAYSEMTTPISVWALLCMDL